MPELSVPWGHDELGISLPSHWTVEQVAAPSLKPAPANWPRRLAMALSQPVAGEALGRILAARRHGRVALVVEDVTRHSPVPEILPVVMREIRHARIGDDQVEVVFATGMHPPMTPEQARKKLGPAMDGIRWRSNPWHDRGAYECVGQAHRVPIWLDRGVARADVRILIASVTPHLQAGFGGGYKMYVPGCAHLQTIRALHRLGLGRRARQLVGLSAARNAMRAAIDAAGRLVDSAGGRTFAIQYLLDEQDRPTSVATGEVIPTHRMLLKQCSVACGIVTAGTADVLITNAHPRDFDLWQCLKCIPNTLWAARPNGVVICLARCEAGLYGMNVPPWPISPTWTRRLFRLLGPETFSGLLTRLVPSLADDAAFFVRLAAQTLCRNPILMVSPALHASDGGFPGLAVLASVDEAIAAADRLLPAGPRRVVVFPSGGVTFPIPPPPLTAEGRATSQARGAARQ
ncbi:MAG: lactate racemase domain-containing protein [Phycisphaerae bacterium]